MIRAILIVVELIVGVGAVAGGILGLSGSKLVPREWLRGTPFKTYLVPGLALLVLVGGSMLAAAGLLIGGASAAKLVSFEAGAVLLAWVFVQANTVRRRHWSQTVMAALGFAVAALSLFLPSPG